jgi:bifunctional non-homologous end joining protein LigD
MISWAVPKGPSYDPAVKRLAVKVEDHPLEYRNFEGTIAKGNYGAGSVIIWDEGTYRNLTVSSGRPLDVREAVDAGHVSFWLQGTKLIGGWSLTRTGRDATSWALVKRRDEHADPSRDVTAQAPQSVRSGRTVFQVGEAGAGLAATSSPGAGPFAAATFLEPMLAQASQSPVTGARGPLVAEPGKWLFEPKLDGLRCLAVRNGPEVGLWSRNRLSFSTRFPELVEALLGLAVDNIVLDGEIIANVDGRPDFATLQQSGAGHIEYWCFDLLWLLGQDVRHLPIEARKSLLSRAVQDNSRVKVLTVLEGDPGQLLAGACREGWEGLMAKRAGSQYGGGRSAEWRKFKCTTRQEMVIGGFTDPKGARSGFGAVLVGYWGGGELHYAGKVGTGFAEQTLRDMRRQLASLERASSPFAAGAVEKGAHWVEPELVAEVGFSNWTAEGRIRHPRFLGLRPDKASGEVVSDEPGGLPWGPS